MKQGLLSSGHVVDPWPSVNLQLLLLAAYIMISLDNKAAAHAQIHIDSDLCECKL